MKKEINVFEYADRILKGLSRGALLTTKSGERINDANTKKAIARPVLMCSVTRG